MPTTDDILAERGQRYGDFDKHADITQSLKKAMASTPGWQRLAPDQREALKQRWAAMTPEQRAGWIRDNAPPRWGDRGH